MSEPRPRPEYGEYASPEEQRIRQGLPAVPPVPPHNPLADTPAPAIGPPPGAVAGLANRVITVALLVFGALSVLGTLPAFLRFDEALSEQLSTMGMGELADPATVRIIGIVGLIVFVVCWALGAWWSLRRLKAGKSSWWIPLIAAVAAYLIVSIALTAALLNDPGYMSTILNG